MGNFKTVVVGKIMAADRYDNKLDAFDKAMRRVPDLAAGLDNGDIYYGEDVTLPVCLVEMNVEDAEKFLEDLGRNLKGHTGVIYLRILWSETDYTVIGADDDWQLIDNSDLLNVDLALNLRQHNGSYYAAAVEYGENADRWTMISKLEVADE